MKMELVRDERRNRTIVQIDDARIIWPNFEGRGDKFNRPGDRNFTLVIPDMDMAEALIAEGYNVKISPPREEGEEPFIKLLVKVRFNEYGPKVHLQTGNKRVTLSEDSVGCLDKIDLMTADIDIRPYAWERPDGSSGVTAYLQGGLFVQELDRFGTYDSYDEE